MLEMNVTIAFPAAPLLTVILALVGKISQYEPHYMTKPTNECAPSEDSDQAGHLPILIRVFAVHSMGS